MSIKMLSKSRYLNGLQCPRLLWIATNEPERIPEPDAATQHIFDQGHLVGELSKKLFPGGIDLPQDDFTENIRLTRELLSRRKPLFEAGIMAGRTYSRLDILKPVTNKQWDIIEVKSATSVKDVNIEDVSFQKVVCEDSGLRIRKCHLACINNQYVKNGEIRPEELFTIQDVSSKVEAAIDGIRDRIDRMLNIIDSPDCPDADIGPHCSNPYDCPLTECREGLPEHNVFTLYYGGKKSHELYGRGIKRIIDIPAGFNLNDKQRIQYDCVVSGQPYMDAQQIKDFIASLSYPLHFLDFETINPAVPLFDGTRPYQNIPFQFSLHVQPAPGAETQHFWYLAEGPQDPRPELMVKLLSAVGKNGSVIAYHKSFEEGCLRDLAEAFPEDANRIDSIISRMEDLIVPFRSFAYYHPLQKGSASLKNVLPAVTGKGYEGLAIAEGGEASLRYLDITYGELSEEEKQKTRQDLLTYCGLDTEGMVWILEKLRDFLS
ncbi:MAG TPA: DUF2779 domain-containing protein [Dehalococcoidales bacterium]|nr:DUF2779 domain-containing protein [Dehalococcoidales bacterium]